MGPPSQSDRIEGVLSPKLKVYDLTPLCVSVRCTTCGDVLRTCDDGGRIQHDPCINQQLNYQL